MERLETVAIITLEAGKRGLYSDFWCAEAPSLLEDETDPEPDLA